MNSSLDSIGLFIKQVKHHAEVLTELLSNGLDSQQASDLMEQCIVSTNMLSGSTAVMGLDGWQDCLSACESLISRYRNLSLPWDERIAQIVSELIEKEELLVSAHEGGDIGDLSSIVPQGELQALLEEANALLDTELAQAATVPEIQPAPAGPVPARNEASEPTPGLFPGCNAALKATVEALFDEIARCAAVTDPPGGSMDDLRKQLFLIGYYARSMDEIACSRQGQGDAFVACSLQSVETVLQDYVNELNAGTGRRMQIEFTGRDIQIDAALLNEIGQVLIWMVHDIYKRSEEDDFQVTIAADRSAGSIKWELKDNGNNFISDSRLDHDEILAFYPSLKKVRKSLAGLNSMLWVEPEGQASVRFAFTTPISKTEQGFQVWGKDNKSFAVLTTQLCSIKPKDDLAIESDARGDHLILDNQRVPLIKLELLYSDAPEQGDYVAIIGALEKRFALYVDGEGRIEAGDWLKESVSTWKGHIGGTARLEQRRVPLVEADDLMKKYTQASGNTGNEEISGGVVIDDTDLSQGQATFEEDSTSPPESTSALDGLDVLVVERSNAVTEEYESMFNRAKIKFQVVDTVEAALDILRNGQTRLIISEFRMPAMAAKVIVDTMNEEGLDIPLLVTTSHTGANAQLLVEKLGVSGYLSKPLDEKSVFAKVNDYFQDGDTAA